MLESASLPQGAAAFKGIAAVVGAVALAGTLGGYAIHEHNAAQDLTAKNQQAAATMKQQQQELMDLTSKVNVLVAREQQAPEAAPAQAQVRTAGKPRAAVRRADPRWQKMQSQLDAQNKAIEDTRTALAGTQGDLNNTRTELTGSIAHTHDELVLLQKRGERNYAEFDLSKSKQFARTGPFSVRLRKANEKHQYADLDLIVDDRTLTQKHVNLYQPVMFSTPDSPQPVQVVINQITKDHIHGYIAAPKYRQSELASMAPAGQTAPAGQDPDGGTVQVADPALQTRPRQSVPQ